MRGICTEKIKNLFQLGTIRPLTQFCQIRMNADQTNLFHVPFIENLRILIKKQFTYQNLPIGRFIRFNWR